MTSRQRSFLMKEANGLEPVFQIGKAGLTPELTAGVREALEARELIKIHLLKSCPEEIRPLADTLAGRTRSQVVRIVGRRIILYRPSKKKIFLLPDE